MVITPDRLVWSRFPNTRPHKKIEKSFRNRTSFVTPLGFTHNAASGAEIPRNLKKTLDRLPYSHAQASVTHNQTKRSIKRFDGNATVERAV
ncbi:hypothetical protein DPMN_052850 [Dreissena polymorpha]|uniref:Uncharacterized protein n=1 Tax=Dreissena polymorpha TaxID=45954 RepID=A0A9D4CLZ8_DREPO|nr:hypothetical protein DPMN_052850 [Dreissena polymorpha]